MLKAETVAHPMHVLRTFIAKAELNLHHLRADSEIGICAIRTRLQIISSLLWQLHRAAFWHTSVTVLRWRSLISLSLLY